MLIGEATTIMHLHDVLDLSSRFFDSVPDLG